MEKDQDILLIFGRPFLAMERALIDVKNRELTLRVNNEHILFSIYRAMKFHKENKRCNSIEVVETCAQEHLIKILSKDPLKQCIVQSIEQGMEYFANDMDCVFSLEAS